MAYGDYTLWMSLALDAMLAPDEERRLHEHLRMCADCRATWELWQQLDQRLHMAPMVAPAPGFAMRVDGRLRARALRRRGAIGGLLLIIGAVALWSALLLAVLLAAGWWLAHRPSLLVQGVSFVARLASVASALLRGVQLAWEGLLAPSAQPALIGYVVILIGLAILWAQIVPRRKQPIHMTKGH